MTLFVWKGLIIASADGIKGFCLALAVKLKAVVAARADPIFYESVIAKSLYNENRLAEIHLFPIDLGHSKRFANRGVPSLADTVKASLILERLQKLSEPFGTKITIKDGVGIVRPALPVPNHNDAR
ncbi:hypothetical protein [Rhizobium laguerreae]|uniref:hypothetical protein n=1 Tax=Rhizobium laguerreae TaxID=1076926 RepID=UPI0021B0EFE3|nr:hypothetical protein [Rhizobium laguerreae]